MTLVLSSDIDYFAHESCELLYQKILEFILQVIKFDLYSRSLDFIVIIKI